MLRLHPFSERLNRREISEIEHLKTDFGTGVFCAHFLDRLCTHILAAEGEGQWTWFEGNFEEYEADRVARLGDDAPRPIKYATLA